MKSLFLRVFLSFWIAMTLIGVSSAVVWVVNDEGPPPEHFEFIFENALKTYGSDLADALRNGGKPAADALATLANVKFGGDTYLYRGEELLYGTGSPPSHMPDSLEAASASEFSLGSFKSGAAVHTLELEGSGTPPLVIALTSPHPTRLEKYLQPETLPIRLIIYFLVSGLVCFMLARWLTRPIEHLQSATQALGKGDLEARVHSRLARGSTEIAALGRDFDRMADHIEALVESHRRLLTDVSHELRSPLARLTIALELAKQDAPEATRKNLDRIEKESNALEELIAQSLLVARLTHSDDGAFADSIALDELTEEISSNANFEASAKACNVKTEIFSPLSVKGNRTSLQRAIENVVRNAVHFTPPGGTAFVTLSRVNDQAQIVVRDGGPGVPPENLKQIFRPFFRLDGARDRKTGGAGIGLTIAQRAIQAHGGKVTAVNAPSDTGLIVTLSFPC